MFNEVGVDPFQICDDDTGRTPLHVASVANKDHVLEYMLKHPRVKEMLLVKDKDGKTPYQLARSYESKENRKENMSTKLKMLTDAMKANELPIDDDE